MKKFYNNPEINISMFKMENVVTSSGATTAENLATEKLTELGVSEDNIVTFTW